MNENPHIPPILRERETGKLANTGVTNELARAINGLTPALRMGVGKDGRLVSPNVLVKIIATATGGGKYTGRRATNVYIDLNTGTLSWNTALVFGDDDDCLVVNAGENETGGHALAIGAIYPGVVLGNEQNAGNPLVVISPGGSLPVGQYQYQVLQMVAQNTVGYDWPRFHPNL